MLSDINVVKDCGWCAMSDSPELNELRKQTRILAQREAHFAFAFGSIGIAIVMLVIFVAYSEALVWSLLPTEAWLLSPWAIGAALSWFNYKQRIDS